MAYGINGKTKSLGEEIEELIEQWNHMAYGINGKTESIREELEELKAQLEKLRTYGA